MKTPYHVLVFIIGLALALPSTYIVKKMYDDINQRYNTNAKPAY